jgi:hypothetical protein
MDLTNTVPGGTRARRFTSATFDLDAHGYLEEEWFLRFEAATLAAVDAGYLLEPDAREGRELLDLS